MIQEFDRNNECNISNWSPVLKIFCNENDSLSKTSSIIRGSFALGGLGIACGTDKGKIFIHDLETGKRILSLKNIEVDFDIKFNNDYGINDIRCDFSGNYLVSCYSTGTVSIYDLRANLKKDSILNSKALNFVNTHKGSCTSVSISKNWSSNFIYTGGYDGYIRSWDIRRTGFVSEVLAHEGSITSLELEFDSKIISSTSFDGKIRMWRSSNLQLLKTLSGPQNSKYALHSSFSYDCCYLQCMGNDSSCIWDFRNEQLKKKNIFWKDLNQKNYNESIFNNQLVPKYTGFSLIWRNQLIIPRTYLSNIGDAFVYGLNSTNCSSFFKSTHDSNSVVTSISGHPRADCNLILTTSSCPKSSFVVWMYDD